jgi:3-oxoacyl-[acyl-carrier-protein] synthase II
MARRVLVTGLGTVTAAGVGFERLWDAVLAGESKLARIEAFDPAGFDVRIAGEVRDFKANKVVPKSYRKATKVMARDIELAVGAADAAVRDAGVTSPGTDPDAEPTYPGPRMGAHIGAGLIAAELDELTGALVESRNGDGRFDLHHWGREGMMNLTPLWLLKYLPNMLACHVTIIHDAQGPSNTITCAEASGGLSLAESVRVIQRNKADLCFCGGAESKLNPMAFYRQVMTGRLTDQHNDAPAEAVRPFDRSASGTAIGEGGGIVVIEAADTAEPRGARAYAEVLGYGAGMSVYPEGRGLEPEPDGRGIAGAIRHALTDASCAADEIDAVVAFGSGIPAFDRAEAAALRQAFGERAADVPIWSAKPYIGNLGAGAGGVDVAIAAKMLQEQKLPAALNVDEPLEGLDGAKARPAREADLQRVLVLASSLGGQNVAIILGRA